MPVPGFLASFADKAQSAIAASPLAGHLPTSSHHARPTSPDPAPQPSANEAAGQGKNHTLEALSYQFRALQQQYGTTTPVQKIITTEKGVSIDFDNVSRDSKAQSKELYTWGQTEADDLKDVTDRLAYLNFVQGSLAASLSAKLDTARTPLKALRDAEVALQPRRNIRAAFQSQIARLEHDQVRGGEKKIAELRDQLRKAEADDHQQELDIDLLKRKAVRESEQIKWEAIREYGEKLVLLSQAAPPIIAVLPSIPPTPNTPYNGAQTTGAVRASLQRALDNYKTGHINLPPQVAAADLSRSDTRSFGESHASELSSIHSDVTSNTSLHSPPAGPVKPVPIPASATTPLASTKPLPSGPAHESFTSHSPPINPQSLNLSPAPIPHQTPSPQFPAAVSADPTKPAVALPTITPTVAETGTPLSAGADGPGPASGSLHDIHGASSNAGPRSGGLPQDAAGVVPEYGQSPPPAGFIAPGLSTERHETAEEEKRRLAAMYSQQQSATGPTSAPSGMPVPSPSAPAPTSEAPPHHETAEEEKKRLEREERERILHGGSGGTNSSNVPRKDDDLPPYQEPGSLM